jgi:nucleotide-binding universal stress UspA family protein
LFQAMGYSFIALQGFDLIAAVGGEIRDPQRTVPRAMFASLAIGLAIYLPLLLTMTCVGVDAGRSILEAAAEDPESVVALAAERFWGPVGYWMVLIAGVLAMASALQANLYAASRVAMSMARDHTLPEWLGRASPTRRIPVAAVWLSAGLTGGVLSLMPDVAAAGAASSLIFLLTFALAHWTTWLARRRVGRPADAYATPWFPLVPWSGGLCCVALAGFQGIAVPSAGMVTVGWAAVGGLLYSALFARKARLRDAELEAVDPQLAQLRGKSPLVLVPIANPANAPTLLDMAHAIASPGVGRVLMLSVVCPPHGGAPEALGRHVVNAQNVLRESLYAALQSGHRPEALTTLAEQPWDEIARVARVHRCESLLIGFGRFDDRMKGSELEYLVSRVDCDVALLRAPPRWRLSAVRRMLIPIAGRSGHDLLRARLLASLFRAGVQQFSFLRILPQSVSDLEYQRAVREAAQFIREEVPGRFDVQTIRCDDVAEGIVRYARDCGLLVLGLQRYGRRHKGFGRIVLRVAEHTSCPMVLISSRR